MKKKIIYAWIGFLLLALSACGGGAEETVSLSDTQQVESANDFQTSDNTPTTGENLPAIPSIPAT